MSNPRELIVGEWMGRPDPAGEYAGIYYHFGKRRAFSDVIQFPNADALVFVDDSKRRRLYKVAMGPTIGEPNPSGEPIRESSVIRMPLGSELRLEDGEALTTDGVHYIYATSSHALKKRRTKREEAIQKPLPHALVRLHIGASNQLTADGVVTGLREALVARYNFIRAVSDLPPQKGGLNIEGLAWDEANQRLLIGLRAPLLDSCACLLPVKIASRAPFALEHFDFEDPISLKIVGKGVRSIQFDRNLNRFLILTGNVKKGSGSAFSLWLWDGHVAHSPQHVEAVKFRDYFNPEGAAGVRLSNGEEFVIIVSDNDGGYLILRYDELRLDAAKDSGETVPPVERRPST